MVGRIALVEDFPETTPLVIQFLMIPRSRGPGISGALMGKSTACFSKLRHLHSDPMFYAFDLLWRDEIDYSKLTTSRNLRCRGQRKAYDSRVRGF